MASFRDMTDMKSREAYEKMMALFDKRHVEFEGRMFVAAVAGSLLADYMIENGKAEKV